MPIEISDLARKIWAEELEEFVPYKIFDVHLHLAAAEHSLAEPDG